MKTAIVEIPRLYEIKANKTQQIKSWDKDNAYPQRYMWLADHSVTASSCLDAFEQFLGGEGWEDEAFADQIIGPDEYTGADLLEDISKEYSQHRGHAIIVGINGLFEHSSYQVEPFERVRIGDGQRAGWYGVHEHWGLTGKKFQPKKDIQWFRPYTTDPDLIMSYIEEVGGFDNFPGMLLYTSINKHNYSEPKYAAALNDVETEAGAAIFKRRNVRTGFMASHIFKFSEEFENQNKRDEMKEKLKKFQGADEAMKIFMLDGVDEEDGQDLTIEKVDIQEVDGLFEHTEESVADNIRKRFLTPKILIGQEEAAGFDIGRMRDARAYYNSIVVPDREKMIRPVRKLVSHFERPIKSNDNWKVKELYSDEQQVEDENKEGNEPNNEE